MYTTEKEIKMKNERNKVETEECVLLIVRTKQLLLL
jgi:hypothetical protein